MPSILNEQSCEVPQSWVAMVTTIFSILAMITAIPLNTVVLITVGKNKKFHSNFHFIIFNIALADVLIGIVLCPLSTYLHVNEARDIENPEIRKQIFRFGMITLSTASLLSMTVLSIDRMISLKIPQRYREMKKMYFLVSLACVWLSTFFISPVYLLLNFTLYLTIVSISIVLITSIVMVITYLLYKANLKKSKNLTFHIKEDTAPIISQKETIKPDENISKTETSSSRRNSLLSRLKRISRSSSSANTRLQDYHFYQLEKRATNTFFYILLVFLACYMPIVGMSIYLNSCQSCYCTTVNIIREAIIIFFMASSVLKTLVFLLRLTALRKACMNLFLTEKELERRWRSESAPPQAKEQTISKGKMKNKKVTYTDEEQTIL